MRRTVSKGNYKLGNRSRRGDGHYPNKWRRVLMSPRTILCMGPALENGGRWQ